MLQTLSEAYGQKCYREFSNAVFLNEDTVKLPVCVHVHVFRLVRLSVVVREASVCSGEEWRDCLQTLVTDQKCRKEIDAECLIPKQDFCITLSTAQGTSQKSRLKECESRSL